MCVALTQEKTSSDSRQVTGQQTVSREVQLPDAMRTALGHTLLVVMVFAVAQGKIGFVKDQSMDATFPPPVFKQDSSLPEGHLRPLGWQRRPDGKVKEVEEMPYTREFYNDYVRHSRPVVFRQGIKDAPALSKWDSDDYLQTKYGKVNVSVTVKVMRRKDEVQTAPHVMKLKKFLYDYMYEDWYLASTVPLDMMLELPLPKCLRCGTLSQHLQEAELWMSSGGTSSRLHSHDDHNLHCVLFGRRDFILIQGQFKTNFNFHLDFEGSKGGHSKLDMEMINAFKYKNIRMTPWTYSTLHPGDCILVPAGYLHHVRSYGRSLSLTVLFSSVPDFSDDGCKLTEEEFRPLSDATFAWTFAGGQRQLTKWQMDAEDLRQLLLVQMGGRPSLPYTKFLHFYDRVMSITSDKPTGEVVFHMLTSPSQVELTRSAVQSLSTEALDKVAAILNAPHNARRQGRHRDEF
ncbi:uncharacterized protein LOC143277193 isoform X2 [Babylonia areolata]|uniref:uncharacterized protein LOC143277193 isoform X2 n=1 Tax=Babylonia areolata TaxID=304850 RepID=UPI003FD13929